MCNKVISVAEKRNSNILKQCIVTWDHSNSNGKHPFALQTLIKIEENHEKTITRWFFSFPLLLTECMHILNDGALLI